MLGSGTCKRAVPRLPEHQINSAAVQWLQWLRSHSAHAHHCRPQTKNPTRKVARAVRRRSAAHQQPSSSKWSPQNASRLEHQLHRLNGTLKLRARWQSGPLAFGKRNAHCSMMMVWGAAMAGKEVGATPIHPSVSQSGHLKGWQCRQYRQAPAWLAGAQGAIAQRSLARPAAPSPASRPAPGPAAAAGAAKAAPP